MAHLVSRVTFTTPRYYFRLHRLLVRSALRVPGTALATLYAVHVLPA